MHYQNDELTNEWYVVFTEAKYDHWIWRFVDKSIGHVYAVKDLNDYQWLKVQPRVNMTEVTIMLKCQYPVIQAITGPDAKTLKVKVEYHHNARGGINFFTCVEQVKALLGIRSFWTLTPKQLYNGLMGNRYGQANRAVTWKRSKIRSCTGSAKKRDSRAEAKGRGSPS